jgi:hypothetical protein
MAVGFTRIGELLGAPVRAGLTQAHLQCLVEAGVEEAEDIEFKREPWPPRDNVELAKDVAAFANSRGGVIVVGIEEHDGAASALTPFPLGDADLAARVRNVACSRVHPTPRLEAFVVRADGDDERGFLVVAVPRSSLAPHAVSNGDWLRYPARYGAQTVDLTESEVAGRYRDRFASAAARVARVRQVMADGRGSLEVHPPWVALAAVPVAPGRLAVDEAARARAEAWAAALGDRPFGNPRPFLQRPCRTGFRRLRFGVHDASSGLARGASAELHDDGAVFAASQLLHRPPDAPEDADAVHEHAVVERIAAALFLAARWGVDVAGTDGEVLVAATILVGGQPVALWHRVGPDFGWLDQKLLGGRRLARVPTSERTLDMAALAEGRRDWLVATRLVANDLLQAFGLAETSLVSPEGVLRTRHVGDRQTVLDWARSQGIDVED